MTNNKSMNKQQLVNYLLNFSETRQIFHSEADFQLAFGMYLKDLGYLVRLEKCFKNIGGFNKIELDIEINGKIAIELKYKTAAIVVELDGELFNLKQHGAIPIGRYQAVEDAIRVKELIDSTDTNLNKGFTIFLSNESQYWTDDAKKSISRDFSLAPNRMFGNGETLKWYLKNPDEISVNKKSTKSLKDVVISFSDKIEWFDYSELNSSVNSQFKFFILDLN